MFVCTLTNFIYTFIAGFIVGIIFVILLAFFSIKRHENETDNNL